MSDYFSLSLPLTADPSVDTSPTLILPSSPIRLRRFVEQFAWHFKREMHFDFVQFEAAESTWSPGFVPYEAYLFHEASEVEQQEGYKRRLFGACCFRWREWENAPAAWSLDWVWFHPYFRGREHLKNAWRGFEQKYGRFHFASPVSPAMEKFLRAAGRLKPRTPLELADPE